MGLPDGLDGTVTSIAACPAIEGGPGRVVLTTVNHLNDFVFDLMLKGADGQTETLGVTGYHKFDDAVTQQWRSVCDVSVGETLIGKDGQEVTVASVTREVGLKRVYNMTVEADHVYYVGDLTTLTHNTGCEAHHLATNKSDIYTPYFEDLFESVGYSLDEDLNLVRVKDHVGPHPDLYHEIVYERLTSSMRSLKGEARITAFEREMLDIADDVQTPGTDLNYLVTHHLPRNFRF